MKKYKSFIESLVNALKPFLSDMSRKTKTLSLAAERIESMQNDLKSWKKDIEQIRLISDNIGSFNKSLIEINKNLAAATAAIEKACENNKEICDSLKNVSEPGMITYYIKKEYDYYGRYKTTTIKTYANINTKDYFFGDIIKKKILHEDGTITLYI